MKATICEFENGDCTLWEGEVLSADWDSSKGEFVICGDAGNESFSAVVTSIAEGQRLTIGMEDTESTQLVWRGQVGSAKFGPFEAERVECRLVMNLEDWFGVCPEFGS
jgi:hypothetical protein